MCYLDIGSLYIKILHSEGVYAISELLAIHRDANDLPQNHYINELLRIVMANNFFDFNGRHFHQVAGPAMGTKLAPSYDNIFTSHFEDQCVYTYQNQPTLQKKFIDDIFLLMTCGYDELVTFITHMNTVHPTKIHFRNI